MHTLNHTVSKVTESIAMAIEERITPALYWGRDQNLQVDSNTSQIVSYRELCDVKLS
jgi:hypothetical protein